MDQRIRRFIRKTRLWVFVKNNIDYLFWCLPVGVGVGMIVEMIGFFKPWYRVHHWSLGAVLVAVIVTAVISIVKFPTAHKAAAELDKSGLKERAQTAVELLGKQGGFYDIQKKDAYRAMLGAPIRKQIPIKLSWKRPAILFVVSFLMISFVLLPSEAKDVAAKQYEVAKQAKEEAEKIEEVKEDLKEELSQEEAEEFKNTLNDIIKEIRDAKSKEEIEKSLERAETKLEQMAQKTESEKARNQMKELAKALNLDRNGDNKTKENSEALAAAQELEKMLKDLQNLDNLSDEEKQALLDKLSELEDIAAAELSDVDLENLQQLAGEISQGQLSDQALQNAQATISGLKDAQLALANQNGNQNNNPNGNQNNGQGQGQGQGQGNGNGQGQGQGQGNGNGNGQGQGQGQGGSGHGGGWNYGGKNGTEEKNSFGGDMVSIPNETGDDANLTGKKTDGTSYTQKGGESITWSGNQVEYSKVYAEYNKKATKSIQNGSYPSGVQDIIKSYFEKISN